MANKPEQSDPQRVDVGPAAKEVHAGLDRHCRSPRIRDRCTIAASRWFGLDSIGWEAATSLYLAAPNAVSGIVTFKRTESTAMLASPSESLIVVRKGIRSP